MGPFSFFVRTLIFTVLFVLFLQIRWGDRSLEDVTMNFLTSSAVVAPLNQTAQGAVRFIRNMWSKANHSFDTHFSHALQEENRPGSRHLNFSMERSEKVLRREAEKVKDVAEDAYEDAKDSSTFQKFKDTAKKASDKFHAKLDERNVPAETHQESAEK